MMPKNARKSEFAQQAQPQSITSNWDRENLPWDQRHATLTQLQPLLDPDCAAKIGHLPLQVMANVGMILLLFCTFKPGVS